MQPQHDDQIARFLETHRFQIIELLDQAYGEAGGHYAALSPEARREQAATDSGEYIGALIEGTIDRAAVQAVAHQARDAGIDLRDILRMSNALERHVTGFIAATLPQEPE